MSYCRWSSDGFQCDLYCYESVTGYVIHVAARRHKERSPALSINGAFNPDYPALHSAWSRRQEELGDDAFQDINLPDDGENFEYDEIEEFRDKISELINMGYQVPEYVLSSINEEIAEQENGSN